VYSGSPHIDGKKYGRLWQASLPGWKTDRELTFDHSTNTRMVASRCLFIFVALRESVYFTTGFNGDDLFSQVLSQDTNCLILGE
jgi:hypothetical protein